MTSDYFEEWLYFNQSKSKNKIVYVSSLKTNLMSRKSSQNRSKNNHKHFSLKFLAILSSTAFIAVLVKYWGHRWCKLNDYGIKAYISNFKKLACDCAYIKLLVWCHKNCIKNLWINDDTKCYDWEVKSHDRSTKINKSKTFGNYQQSFHWGTLPVTWSFSAPKSTLRRFLF